MEISQRPYPPSWFDRLKMWVDRLPIPWWLFYLIIGLVPFPIFTWVQWDAGSYPVGTFSVFHLWLALQLGYVLAIMHYLDKVALDALAKTRYALKVDTEEYARLQYELTTLPARPTLWASILSPVLPAILFLPVVLLTSKDGYSLEFQVSTQVLSMTVFGILNSVSWFLIGPLLVHTFRQLQFVSRIYREYVKVDLINLDPLYAFSGLTARSAILLVGIPYPWFATNPVVSSFAPAIATGVIMTLIAGVTFISPLWGIHRRLAEEKAQAVTDNQRRSDALVKELMRGMDAGDLTDAAKIKDALTAFEIQHKTLDQLPTWPWKPETFRLLVSAVLLPTILFLLQFVLQRFLK